MFGIGANRVDLKLDRDEAIVLFEVLARWIDDAPKPTPDPGCFDSPSEIYVLHQLYEKLKVSLPEPERSDYLAVLAEARGRYADAWLGETLQD